MPVMPDSTLTGWGQEPDCRKRDASRCGGGCPGFAHGYRSSLSYGECIDEVTRDNGDGSDLMRSFPPPIVTKLVMTKKNFTDHSRQTRQAGSMWLRGWKLGEAKAKFSRVVRLAASGQPQRVTVRGKDAVVVVAADEFERLRARAASGSLHELLCQSPLNRLDFDEEGVQSPVREVEL